MIAVALGFVLASSGTPVGIPAVEVVEPEIRGDVPKAWPAKVRARLIDVLTAGGVDCTDGAHGLTAALTLAAVGRDYELQLVLRDAESDEAVATVAQTCDTCGFAELSDSVEALGLDAVRALSKGDPLPASIKFTSTPPGAEVSLDGQSVGTTPLEVPVTAGQHTMTVAAPDHVAHRRRIVVAAGEVLSLDTSLSPRVSMAERRAKQHRVRLTVGASAVAAGVGGIAVGAAMLAIHGKPVMADCAGTDVDLEGDCRYLHETKVGGGIAFGLGAALAVSGAVVLGITMAKRKAGSRVAVSPLGVRGRF
ncbi:MAG: PEGA domain-containing protein [Myxococcota bacterium]